MRQFSGFGSPQHTNERYKFLIDNGQTGLSVAFDMPTLMGRDSDEPHSAGAASQSIRSPICRSCSRGSTSPASRRR